jgi:pimeloyl-ACP methyl ester carboxylesterase
LFVTSSARARIRLKLARLALRGLARLWPRYADQRAIELFATPVRPQAKGAYPLHIPGLAGTRLTVAFVDLDGIPTQLSGWSWGAGPTVLLSHGWNAHAGHLLAFVPPLVQAGYRAVAFDHLGHGASGGHRSNVRAFRDGLRAVSRACGGEVAGVIAHSLGATTAILALQNHQDLGQGGPANALSARAGAPFALIAPPLDPVRYALASFSELMGLAPERQAAILARLRGFVGTDLDAPEVLRLARAQSRPALIVHDDEDRPVPIADGRALASAWPGSRFHGTSGLGHRRILTDPTVVAAVIRFVTSASSSSL